jgi:YNFM family putative membrane transporter
VTETILTDPPDLIDNAVDAGHPYDLRLLAVTAAGFCVFLSVYCTQSLLPMLQGLFHVPESKAAMTVTATTIGVAITAPWVSLLSGWIGRKRVIVGSIFVLVIPTLGAATASTFDGLIAWRFAQGLFMSGIIAVTMAYVSAEWPPHHVGSAMSAYVTGNVLGGVTGRMLAGWIGEHWGWQQVFFVMALLDIIGGVIVLFCMPKPKAVHTPTPLNTALADMARHLVNPRLLSTFFVGSALLMALVATLDNMAVHMARAPYSLGPTKIGMLFLVYLVGVVVTPFGGRFIDRTGQRFALVIAVLMSMAGILLTLIPSIAMAIIGLAICCSGIFVGQSSTASYMGLSAGKAKGSASGLYAMFYYTGGAAGAFIAGRFWRFGDWPVTVGFVLAIFTAAAIVAGTVWGNRASRDSG